ncbi:MAG: VTT domain-containing protein [Proteobacteria bacterium]|nr:VTT domain-containing protein [Pseudomonadota bacterium]
MSAKALLRSSALFVSLVLVVGLMKATDLVAIFDEAWIDAYVRGHGLSGWLVFIAGGLVFTAVGLPRQLVGFLGGYAFGVATGTGLALAAVTLGCIVAFYYARFLGRDFVAHRFPSKVQRIDRFLSENPLTMTLLIRFLPVGSNLATNLAAGVSSVRATPFFAGSLIGYLPQTLAFALVGSGVSFEPWFRIGLGAVLFAVSGVMGVYLYRRLRHGLSFDDDVDRQLDPVSNPGTE